MKNDIINDEILGGGKIYCHAASKWQSGEVLIHSPNQRASEWENELFSAYVRKYKEM